MIDDLTKLRSPEGLRGCNGGSRNHPPTPKIASGPLSPMGREREKTGTRSLGGLLAPFEEIAANSPNLVANPGARFEVAGEAYELPRYVFIGPGGGDAPIRIGIFAGIHGDEPEGSRAIVQFVKLLEAKPELVTGYCLHLYPVCNPAGYEDGTRLSRSGKDLNREFWTDSAEPE